jgi:single-strand DNA-binding protein
MATISFIGNLGRDAELKDINGTPLLKFTVADSTGFGDRKSTSWINCSLWGKQAEALHQYLTKGKQIFVSGEFSTRKYEKKDGGEGLSLDVRVDRVKFAGSRNDEQSSNEAPSFADDESDSVPF